MENNSSSPATPETTNRPTQGRSSLQLPRRLAHMGSGIFAVCLYGPFLNHQQAAYIVGGVSSLVYILEQVRIHYPEILARNKFINQSLLRAGEELKESAAVPYIMGLLLTIISFPKSIALSSILILALADPMSAIIGIKLGKHRFSNGKSIEGSLAFFACCFLAVFFIFTEGSNGGRIALAAWVGILMTIFDHVSLKLDDNLTIPIASAFITWPLAHFFNIPIWS